MCLVDETESTFNFLPVGLSSIPRPGWSTKDSGIGGCIPPNARIRNNSQARTAIEETFSPMCDVRLIEQYGSAQARIMILGEAREY